MGHHPLARRLPAGLEPEVTVRVLDIPALTELRKACTELAAVANSQDVAAVFEAALTSPAGTPRASASG